MCFATDRLHPKMRIGPQLRFGKFITPPEASSDCAMMTTKWMGHTVTCRQARAELVDAQTKADALRVPESQDGVDRGSGDPRESSGRSMFNQWPRLIRWRLP